MKRDGHLASYFFGWCLILGLVVSGLGRLHHHVRENYGESAAAPVEFLIFALPVLLVAVTLYLLWRYFKKCADTDKRNKC